MHVELEAKFLNIKKEYLRKTLKAQGFLLTEPEFLMTRKTMHFPESAKMGNRWGRVRQEAENVTMTIKWVKDPNALDGTFEAEVIVPSLEAGEAFLTACGLTPTATQENYREIWHNTAKTTMVTLDTWPGLHPFVEIEADTEKDLLEAASCLGFDMKNAHFGSVDYIYAHELGFPREAFIALKEVTFDLPPKPHSST